VAVSNGYASYDLHLHTCWSYDATADPEVYFRRAQQLGVRCIAVAEHHNLDSADEVRQVAERYPQVRLIVAAELSVTTSIGAVDLLCYNLPRQPEGALARVLDEYRLWQQRCGGAMSQGMQQLGYDYTDDQRLKVLQTYRPSRVIERQGVTHVKGGIQSQHFVDRGYIRDLSELEALRRRLREVVQMPDYPPVERVAPAVKEAGGLIAIAHPAGYFNGNDRQRMDALREECLLDGVECAHRAVSPDLTAIYRDYCLAHGLFSVGGSDCHDNIDVESPPDTPGHTTERHFARHIGPDAWLDEFLERMA
jgi:predicted metal-dependent phosphoesterase TrpH